MNSKCKSHPIPLLSEDSVTKDYVALKGYSVLKATPPPTHTQSIVVPDFLLCISIIFSHIKNCKGQK